MVETAISLVAIVFSVGAYVGYRNMWDKRDMDKFTDILGQMEAAVDRMEMATFVVAADLATTKTAVAEVAADLKESQQRADEVVDEQPGEAADAAAQSGEEPEEIT